MTRALITLLFFLHACAAFGQTAYTLETIPKPAPPNSYVSNPDGVLSSAMEMEVNAVLRKLDETTTVEVAVVVVNSIGYAVPGDFRTELFRYWGIGKAENDNGLLILLVMDQRRMEFEVGYGLEGILTDIMCKQIQEEYMVPLAKEGDFDGCVRAGVMQVYQILTEPAYRDEVYAESLTYGQSVPVWRQPMSVVFMAIFGGIYLLSVFGGFRSRQKSLKKAPDYVKHQFNDSYVVSKFAMLDLGLPLGFYAWQELSGGIRVFEFWIFVYGLFMVLLFEKRLRLNGYIRREHIGDTPQDLYGVMARSHSKGWLFANIFFPVPFLLYQLVHRIRMRSLRYTAPISADGITPMTLVDEKGDDQFLQAYQLVEENLRSADYDVWQDAATNERKVFRFENFFSKYKECPSCKTKSYLMTKNVTLVSPTYSSTGTGEKTYTCKACNHIHKETYTIAMLTKSSSSGSGGSYGGGGGGGFGGGSSGGGGAGSSW